MIKLNKLIKRVLLANSSQLGFNWIYNSEFLLEHSKNNKMLMTVPNTKYYEDNKPSYNVYENAPLGSFTLQGNILKWLYQDLLKHQVYNDISYKSLLLNKLMPGGSYVGYVESYGKKLVLNELSKMFKKDLIAMDDDQLVGFIPYIAYKALNMQVKEALKLTLVLTNNNNYELYFKALDLLLEKGKQSLNEALMLMPKEHQEKIKLAINSNDASNFIKDTHDLSCSINYAMPVIFYLYNKHNNLLDALSENVVLGGASSDRALLLGLLFDDESLPEEWNYYF